MFRRRGCGCSFGCGGDSPVDALVIVQLRWYGSGSGQIYSAGSGTSFRLNRTRLTSSLSPDKAERIPALVHEPRKHRGIALNSSAAF